PQNRKKKVEYEKGAAAARNEPPDPKLWVRRSEFPATTTMPAHTDAEYARLADNLDRASKELAKRWTPVVAPGPPAHAVVDETGRVVSQWATLSSARGSRSTHMETPLAAWPNSNAAKVGLSLPDAPASV